MGLFRFLVDSRNRTAGSPSSSDFVVPLPVPIKRVRSVALNSLFLPNTVFNIDSTNYTLPVKISGTTYTATLAPGNYTPSALATAVAAQLSSAAAGAGVTFTCSYSTTTFKMTVTVSAGSFQLLFSTSGSPWREMGFTNSDTTSAGSATGPNVVQLDLPAFLLIDVQEFPCPTNFIGSTLGTTAPFYAPLSSNGGDISVYRRSDFPQRLEFCSPLMGMAQLTVRLRGSDGVIRSLNGADFSFLLEIEAE